MTKAHDLAEYFITRVVDCLQRYTTDGTEPTMDSTLWEAPVACQSAIVKAKLFYKDKQSVTSLYMR